MAEAPIKVGMVAELTGPLAFMGVANANVAKMVFAEINAEGGLLGRKIELIIEDGATTDSVAESAATKLVEKDKVDAIFGGIYSSTRQAIKRAAVERQESSISTQSSMKGGNAIRSSSAQARHRPSKSIR